VATKETMNLENLTVHEEQLMAQVDQVQGVTEERMRQLQERGVFGTYDRVYQAYVDMIVDTTIEGTEALKRALFLQWIAFLEPSFFTGIGELDRNLQRRVLEEVQRRVERSQTDDELVWMLRWYDSITEWYFDDFADLPLLHQFLQDKYPDIQLARIFTKESVTRRGQMGVYWLSMLESQEGRDKQS